VSINFGSLSLCYYWGYPPTQSALGRLFQNLAGKPLPLILLSLFRQEQAEKLRLGQIGNTPQTLILDKIHAVLEKYALACG
jgi:tagatose-1,6-bisphosphate aldolase non-catalytic subunit AgaZ/GatZ